MSKVRASFGRLYTRGTLFFALVAVFALSIVSSAFASGEGPDYGKLTEGVTTELDTVVPIVLLALGTVVGISFAIRWAVKHFGGAR